MYFCVYRLSWIKRKLVSQKVCKGKTAKRSDRLCALWINGDVENTGELLVKMLRTLSRFQYPYPRLNRTACFGFDVLRWEVVGCCRLKRLKQLHCKRFLVIECSLAQCTHILNRFLYSFRNGLIGNFRPVCVTDLEAD